MSSFTQWLKDFPLLPGNFTKAAQEETKEAAKFKAVSLSPSALFYQSQINRDGSIRKGGVSFANLRRIADYDYITALCINIIKKEVSQSKWRIKPKDEAKIKDKDVMAHTEMLVSLFEDVNDNGENFRLLMDRVLDDLLTLDAGVIELVRNIKGEVVALNSVDGATIRPVFNLYGVLGPDIAYVQYINDKPVAEFTKSEIVYMMQNPNNDIQNFGYGKSNIEKVLLAVQAGLNADLYNVRAFSEDNIPPGILDLGSMSTTEAEQFKALWDASVITQPTKLKMVWGSDSEKKYIPFKTNQKDMQFVEYIDWISRVKLSIYGLSTMDANITQDINRATSDNQIALSKSRGVKTMQHLVEEYFNRSIIRLAFQFDDVEFEFECSDSPEERLNTAKVNEIYVKNGIMEVNEVRDDLGMDPLDKVNVEDMDANPSYNV